MLGLCLGSSVLSGAHQGLHIVGDLIGHAAAVIVHGISHSCSRFRRRSRGCGCDGSSGLCSGDCGLNALQSLNAGAHLLLNFGNFGVGGQTGLLHPGVLCCDQRLGIAARCGRGSGSRSGPTDGVAIRRNSPGSFCPFCGKGGCAGEVAKLYSRWAAVCSGPSRLCAGGKGKGGISQRRRQPERPSASAGTGRWERTCFPLC